MIFFSEDVVVAHQIPNFFKRFTFLDMYVKKFGDSKMFSKLSDLTKTMKLSERACCWSSAGEVSKLCPNVSTTPITAMGCRQCLPLSVVQLKGKHCRKHHCHNGVVDTFEPCHQKWSQFVFLANPTILPLNVLKPTPVRIVPNIWKITRKSKPGN